MFDLKDGLAIGEPRRNVDAEGFPYVFIPEWLAAALEIEEGVQLIPFYELPDSTPEKPSFFKITAHVLISRPIPLDLEAR